MIFLWEITRIERTTLKKEEGILEEQDFASWWQEASKGVKRRLKRYESDIDPEDVAQNLAMVVWRKWPLLTDQSLIEGKAEWLALDALRASKRVRRVFSQMEEGVEGEVGPNQEQQIALRELERAIKALPPKQRAVIIGMYAGKTETDLAKELNIDEATVRSLRRFGRIKLIKLLEKERG